MKYALSLAEDGRILSVTFEKYAPANAVVVDELPEGNVAEFRYVSGEYIYDPLPEPEQPAADQTLESRVGDLEEALSLILSGVTE